MIHGRLLQEAKQSEDLKEISKRQCLSKIKSLNNYIENLLQKKIRLDLEIRRQKKVLSNIKKQSETLLKTSISMEGHIPLEEIRPLTSEEIEIIKENSELFEFTVDLDREIDVSNDLLQEISELEEFLCKEP